MIRIEKPTQAPTILLERGVERTRQHEAEYDDRPDEFRSGQRNFDLQDAIYGHETVPRHSADGATW